MAADNLQLFKYFNQEYHSTFDIRLVDNTGRVPFVTGDLKQDAFLVYVRDRYGVNLSRREPDPSVFSRWDLTVIDEKKFAWLMLKI